MKMLRRAVLWLSARLARPRRPGTVALAHGIPVERATISAVITRANGTVIDLGVVASTPA